MQFVTIMWMISSFARISGKSGKQAIGKRGAGSLNGKEIDQQVTAIYNDCWKLYREYTKTHDMRQLNNSIVEVKAKYPKMQQFTRDILYAFSPVINSIHAEYLMGIKEE